MNIRDAIYQAADRIESQPKQYYFMSTRKPDCGTPGCMLGWIGFYAGLDVVQRDYADQVSVNLLGVSTDVMYLRIEKILSATASDPFLYQAPHYRESGHATLAQALRLYADEYHPAEVSKVIRPEAGSWDLIPWQPKKVRGFTTIELLTVIAALGALGLLGCMVWAGFHFLAKFW